jgi:negative regulator of flagellin synthesis FlgM
MKIRPPIDVVGSKTTAGGTPERAGGASKGAAAPTASQGDRVQLSSLSTQLHALESSLAASGAFDPERVEAIKQAIRDGKLAIDPQAIADKMLAADLALVSQKP